MPRNEPYWNPYRFVPVKGDKIDRKQPLTGEKFAAGSYSGEVVCSLVNLSPLFIGTNSQATSRPFLVSKRNNKPMIPGSSLKGMFRSLTELVGGGCSVIPTRGATHDSLLPCSDNTNLCIACRMFGMMERTRNPRVLKGKVSIGDALLVQGDGRTRGMDVYLGNPKLTHAAFYQSANGKVDGKLRKSYFHQPARRDLLAVPTGKAAESKWQIQALPQSPDNRFEFRVQFQNLTKEELSLLLYIITLEEKVSVSIPQEKGKPLNLAGPMRHKVGYAKSLGGGSCHISISSIILQPSPKERFSSLAPAKTELEGDALQKEIAELTDRFRSDQSPTMQKLRTMMVWCVEDTREFRFPDYRWFKDGQNHQTTLKPI